MNREDMLRYHFEDLAAVRAEKFSFLVDAKASNCSGYAAAMYHAGMINNREWRGLCELRESAVVYAKRECTL